MYTDVIEKYWKQTDKDSTVTLINLFTGDPASTAKFYKSIFEPILIDKQVKYRKNIFPVAMRYKTATTYKANPQQPFPNAISYKGVTEYLFRSVTKIEMVALIN